MCGIRHSADTDQPGADRPDHSIGGHAVIPSASGQYAGSPWFGISGTTGVTSMSGAFIGQQGTLTTLSGPLTFTAGSTIAASCTTAPGITYSWIFDGSLFWIIGPDCTAKPTAITGYLIDSSFSTLSDACSSAVSQGKTLALTKTWDLNGTCAANLYAFYGGILSPSSGHTTTLSGSFDGVISQHFSIIRGGSFTVSSGFSIKTFYPQWWGAVGDGTTDDRAAIQTAYNQLTAFQQTTLTFTNDTFIIGSSGSFLPSPFGSEYYGINVPSGAVTVCQNNGNYNSSSHPTFSPAVDNMVMFYAPAQQYDNEFHGCAFNGQATSPSNFTSTDGVYLAVSVWPVINDNLFVNFPVNHAAIVGGGWLYGTLRNNRFQNVNGRAMDIQNAYSQVGGTYYGMNQGVITMNVCSACNQGFRVSGQFKWDSNDWEGTLPNGTRAAVDFAESGSQQDIKMIGANYWEGGPAASPTGPTYGIYIAGGALSVEGAQIVFYGTSSYPVRCIGFDSGSAMLSFKVTGTQMRACTTGIYFGQQPISATGGGGGAQFGYMLIAGNYFNGTQNYGCEFASGVAAFTNSLNSGAGNITACPEIGSAFSGALVGGYLSINGQLTGKANTTGTAVSLYAVSGSPLFTVGTQSASYTITINSSPYTIASAQGPLLLTLTTSVGTQTNVNFTFTADYMSAQSCNFCYIHMAGGSLNKLTGALLSGMAFSFQFDGSTTIANSYFHLAANKDVTPPANFVIPFVVDQALVVREVGNMSETIPTSGSLPTCGSSTGNTTQGHHLFITDATTQTWGASVAGGGTPGTKAHIMCDGSGWTVEGK